MLSSYSDISKTIESGGSAIIVSDDIEKFKQALSGFMDSEVISEEIKGRHFKLVKKEKET